MRVMTRVRLSIRDARVRSGRRRRVLVVGSRARRVRGPSLALVVRHQPEPFILARRLKEAIDRVELLVRHDAEKHARRLHLVAPSHSETASSTSSTRSVCSASAASKMVRTQAHSRTVFPAKSKTTDVPRRRRSMLKGSYHASDSAGRGQVLFKIVDLGYSLDSGRHYLLQCRRRRIPGDTCWTSVA